MSEQNTPKEFEFSQEDNAHQTANVLMMDAAEAIKILFPINDYSVADAILIAAHALTAKVDSLETTNINSMNDLRESVDFLAANIERELADEIPTHQEREIMYRALEANLLENSPLEKIEDMDAALLRFKKITGR